MESSTKTAETSVPPESSTPTTAQTSTVTVPQIYGGEYFTILNGNIPNFSESDLTARSYEYYSELDHLGRCGSVIACIGRDIMPTEERGSIGQVKPTGWHTVKYDIVDGKYLYNRCHLIGYQLTGENANVCNLITGTRSMNVDGMLPFEDMVADYVKETGNHVLYRVTPVFEGNELLARGVVMEACSVEDQGEGICFNVFVFNAQPGIEIDYATGSSRLADPKSTTAQTTAPVTLTPPPPIATTPATDFAATAETEASSTEEP
ncbi:MAG: DNA/RNA non-specific endonuclease, partial [Clostridia bacterium]|nr:DNA/RNA non-specific endonuclease [Clostridia bacterium]